MKKVLTICIAFIIAGSVRAQDAKMDAFISNLMSKMTIDEKIGQLIQIVPFYVLQLKVQSVPNFDHQLESSYEKLFLHLFISELFYARNKTK